MISKELYDLVIKANKQAENCSGCDTCFCSIFKSRLQGSSLKHFLDWRAENKGITFCGSVLFYLQDLGFIEVSPGAYDRFKGVRCTRQKYTIIKKIFKVIKYENSKTLQNSPKSNERIKVWKERACL